MKTIYIILIISLISFSNCAASCVGKIAADLTKKSLATTDSITITITNGNAADDNALSGAVSGLSLHPSSGTDVALTCSALSQIAKGASGTVTCTPASALTTAGTFTLVASSATVGAGEVALTVDGDSKTLTIDPNYTEDSGNGDKKDDSGDDDKKDSGSFNKLSSFLLIGALLL